MSISLEEQSGQCPRELPRPRGSSSPRPLPSTRGNVVPAATVATNPLPIEPQSVVYQKSINASNIGEIMAKD